MQNPKPWRRRWFQARPWEATHQQVADHVAVWVAEDGEEELADSLAPSASAFEVVPEDPFVVPRAGGKRRKVTPSEQKSAAFPSHSLEWELDPEQVDDSSSDQPMMSELVSMRSVSGVRPAGFALASDHEFRVRRRRTGRQTAQMSELLRDFQVRDMVENSDFEDPAQFANALRQMATKKPHLRVKLLALASEVEDDEEHTFVEEAKQRRRDLVVLLELALTGHPAAEGVSRRQIRAYAFFLAARTFRQENLPTDVLMQPRQQADLLAKVMGGVEHQGLIQVAEEIKKISATRGRPHLAQKKANKPIDSHLRSARQTVTLGTGVVSWAIFDDVLEAIRANAHRSSDKETQALAQAEWEDKYFKLDLYAIGGEQLTAAEAIGRWTRKGYSWHECKAYLYKKHWPPIWGTTEGRKQQLQAKH